MITSNLPKSTTVFLICMFLTNIGSVHSQSNTPCTGVTISAPNISVNVSCTLQAGTTVGSTAQTNAANGGTPSCGSMGPDVWYSFLAPASGSIKISTTAGTITDGVMALYSGTCGAFTQLDCSDDVNGLMPEITKGGLTPSTKYLIRFWKYGGGTGTFNICVQDFSILPLNIIYFKGQNKGKINQLTWQTANEFNTDHFDIERSVDGASFSTISQILAGGTGDNKYQVVDETAKPGNNYYRLKSVDKDDRYTYSKIIVLKMPSLSDKILTVYPNPAGEQIVISCNHPDAHAMIFIYNLAGQKLLSMETNSQSKISIDINHLKAGTYLIEYHSDKQVMRNKFVKVD